MSIISLSDCDAPLVFSIMLHYRIIEFLALRYFIQVFVGIGGENPDKSKTFFTSNPVKKDFSKFYGKVGVIFWLLA